MAAIFGRFVCHLSLLATKYQSFNTFPSKDAAIIVDSRMRPSLTHTPVHVVAKVLEGSTYCGKASDCWSVGVTLFTMLAGHSPPFSTEATKIEANREGGGPETEQVGALLGINHACRRARIAACCVL